MNSLGSYIISVILDEVEPVYTSVDTDTVGEQKTAHDEEEDSTDNQEEILMDIEFIFCIND